MFETEGYLCDTHTAVGVYAARQYRKEHPESKILVASTASPYKFAPAVLRALGKEAPADDFEAIETLARATGVAVPAPLAALASQPDRFTRIIDVRDMRAEILQ